MRRREIKPGATPRSLLDQLVRGEQALRSLTLLEGWNFREVMAAVRSSSDLTQDLDGLDGAGVMARIGFAGVTWPKQYESGKTQLEAAFARRVS